MDVSLWRPLGERTETKRNKVHTFLGEPKFLLLVRQLLIIHLKESKLTVFMLHYR